MVEILSMEFKNGADVSRFSEWRSGELQEGLAAPTEFEKKHKEGEGPGFDIQGITPSEDGGLIVSIRVSNEDRDKIQASYVRFHSATTLEFLKRSRLKPEIVDRIVNYLNEDESLNERGENLVRITDRLLSVYREKFLDKNDPDMKAIEFWCKLSIVVIDIEEEHKNQGAALEFMTSLTNQLAEEKEEVKRWSE